ncbi:MAG: hypothetical protein KOO62_00270 [candidate division Zixibacteria bacterium]|nr:hypothetical protein [candidate division Zixibacteria bacterium]
MRFLLTVIFSLLFLAALSIAADKGTLDEDLMSRLENQFDKNGPDVGVINAITNNNIQDLSLNRERVVSHDDHFSHRLKKSGITNQRGSGRCWLFAGLNVFHPDMMTRLKLNSFELSQPYLTFWDKMEKANLFLEQMITLRDRPFDDRELCVILRNPFGDGGWWHYVTDLVEKYGVAPISAMPETKQSVSTGIINKLANRKLRTFASELRTMHENGQSEKDLRLRKEEMLGDIYAMLVCTYGQPPTSFTFRYEDKDSTVSAPVEFTPRSFYDEFLADALPEYVTLMDNPGKEYDHIYQIESSRNMIEKADLTTLNLSIEKQKTYVLKSLLDSQAVWFACDVGKANYKKDGIMATDVYDYASTFDMDFSISKRDRILYRDSYPGHAMVIIGVDTTSDGQPIKWLVENSWGTDRGDDGYWYMYDDWFSEYVYFTIIDERHLDSDDRDKFKQDPILCPVWDVFYQALRNSR